MNIDDILETELFKKLSENNAFVTKFYEVTKRIEHFSGENAIFSIDNDILSVGYTMPIHERETNCEDKSEATYEFCLLNGNLIVNEKFGTIRSNYGYTFKDKRGGIIDTTYTCSLYDQDGIELVSQRYVDSYDIKPYDLEDAVDNLRVRINEEYNPSLLYYSTITDQAPAPAKFGDDRTYTRLMREKDSLGLVESIELVYNNDSTPQQIKHELYFNTFLSHSLSSQPESISIIPGYPIGYVEKDDTKVFYPTITKRYGITEDNYKKLANERFLNELKADRCQLSLVDIEKKYDMMIGILEVTNSKTKN